MARAHLAVVQNRHAALAPERPSSAVVTKRPSNASTGSSIDNSHSSWVQSRSRAYHTSTIDPVAVRPSETKMTRAENAKQSWEDMDEKSHKL